VQEKKGEYLSTKKAGSTVEMYPESRVHPEATGINE
jgi:hypothetical protein